MWSKLVKEVFLEHTELVAEKLSSAASLGSSLSFKARDFKGAKREQPMFIKMIFTISYRGKSSIGNGIFYYRGGGLVLQNLI